MKNTMKKIMSLVLVAMLLVSAIPMAASATTGATATIQYWLNGNKINEQPVEINDGVTTIIDLQPHYATSFPAEAVVSYKKNDAVAYSTNVVNNGDIIAYIAVTVPASIPTTPLVTPTNINAQVMFMVEGTTQVIPGGSITIQEGTTSVPASRVSAPSGYTINGDGTVTNNRETYYVAFNVKQDVPPTTEAPTTAPTTVPTTAPSTAPSDTAPSVTAATLAPATPTQTTPTYANVTVIDKNGLSKGYTPNINSVDADGTATIAQILTYYNLDSTQVSTAVWNSQPVTTGASVVNGDTVIVTMKAAVDRINQYGVYLRIYSNLNLADYKLVNITNGIALDNVISMAEVRSVINTYYNAKDANGIGCDGLREALGSGIINWVNDTKLLPDPTTLGIHTIANPETSDVVLCVMITNATPKTTTTYVASDNPKTGDSIYSAFAVMGLSTAALATAMYVYNKKRAAV